MIDVFVIKQADRIQHPVQLTSFTRWNYILLGGRKLIAYLNPPLNQPKDSFFVKQVSRALVSIWRFSRITVHHNDLQ